MGCKNDQIGPTERILGQIRTTNFGIGSNDNISADSAQSLAVTHVFSTGSGVATPTVPVAPVLLEADGILGTNGKLRFVIDVKNVNKLAGGAGAIITLANNTTIKNKWKF